MTGGLAALAALLAAGSATAAAAPDRAASTGPIPPGVVLHGLSGQAATLTPADLARLPQVHISVVHAGRTSDYAGPELASLLRQVDAPLGPRLHGSAVATVVLVTARDGYRVALSLAEIDPDLHTGAEAILADQVDGHPLPPDQAPARLVVGGDARPARDARSVVAIDLKTLP